MNYLASGLIFDQIVNVLAFAVQRSEAKKKVFGTRTAKDLYRKMYVLHDSSVASLSSELSVSTATVSGNVLREYNRLVSYMSRLDNLSLKTPSGPVVRSTPSL